MTKLEVRFCLVLVAVLATMSVQARVITDMAGRKVTIPDKITKVYAAQPYTNVLLYVVAPDKMLGLQPGPVPVAHMDKHFLRKSVMNLPWLPSPNSRGAQSGTGMEEVLKLHPSFVLATGGMMLDPRRLEDRYGRINLPIVFVKLDKIAEYPAAIEFLGKLLGHQARAERMAAFARRIFAKVRKMVAAIPPDKRVSVYYAESSDGLATETASSFHADAIRMAGGNLVHHGQIKSHMGMEKISLEQVLVYNPEVIISQWPGFAQRAYHDPRWQEVKAVRDHRIYTVPRSPFDWIDRPPSVMRIIGVAWLAYRLYPKRYPGNIREDIQDFLRLFMGVQASKADLDAWLK